MTTRRKRPSESIDRLPPHSPEAEQCVLGCIMLAPIECMAHAIDRIAGPESFYDLRHQNVYREMIEMHDAREVIDVVTIAQRLKDRQMLEEVGGIAYISALPDAAPSASAISDYLEIVREKHLLRMMISACTETVSRVYEYEGEVDKLLDEFERDLMKVSQARVRISTPSTPQLVSDAIQHIENCHGLQGKLSGLSSGFPDYNKLTGGLQKDDMIVIAARPSMGKTSLAMNIVEQVCLEDRNPVGVFSLEMSGKSLILRMICSRARVNMRNVSDGFIKERDFPRLTAAAGKIHHAPLYIDDSSGLSILQLRSKARRMFQLYGIKLFVIDYLQLLNAIGGQRRVENRQQEVADISAGIKSLAKELHVPIIVLSQLNRDLEREKNRKPRLSDLRESGSVEQDADVVAFLYKPNCNDGTQDDADDYQPVNLLIAKQRNGPSDRDVHLTFCKCFTRFESAAIVSSEDIPIDRDRQADMEFRETHPDA